MSTITTNFIADGYTESAYIAERPGLYAAGNVKFRPFSHAERTRAQNAIDTAKDPKDGVKVIYLALAKHVVEWDQVDREGRSLKLDAVTMAGLRPAFTERLFNIVAGYIPGDFDPSLSPQAPVGEDDELDRLLEEGPASPLVKQENDAKN